MGTALGECAEQKQGGTFAPAPRLKSIIPATPGKVVAGREDRALGYRFLTFGVHPTGHCGNTARPITTFPLDKWMHVQGLFGFSKSMNSNKSMNWGVLMSMLACVGTLLTTAAEQSVRNPDLLSKIDAAVEAARASDSVPGISVAVFRGEDKIVARGYGWANVENQVPATEDTVFLIGSITKQFTAAAILRLVEQGKISLQDSLGKYLPDYPLPGREATIRQLLNHTSGIRSYTETGPKFWEETVRIDLSESQMLDVFKDLPLDFKPGEQWRYNNSAYYLLGVIIGKVTGSAYREHIEHSLIESLGLHHTCYADRRIIDHRAAGYELDDQKSMKNAAPLSMNIPGAAGALGSTVVDLVKWTRALHDGQVVSSGSLESMTNFTRYGEGKVEPYGFGLCLAPQNGKRFIGHGGGIPGFLSELAYYPEAQLTIVVLANCESAHPGTLQRKLARIMMGLPEPTAKDLPVSVEEIARYSGTYEGEGEKSKILAENGALAMEFGKKFRLLYQGARMFVCADDIEVVITFTPDAKEFTLKTPGHDTEFKRIP